MNVTMPRQVDLAPYLAKLAENPDSVVMIAIVQDPCSPDFGNASWQWFSADERATIKAALLRVRKKREAAKQREVQSC